MVEVITATKKHAEQLAPKLRDIDVREIKVANPKESVKSLLKMCVESSTDTWAIVDNKSCVALFGIRDMENNSGIPWMLSSPEFFTKYYRRFIKETPDWLEKLWGNKTYLFNYISKDNSTSIKWLTKLGFTIHSEKPIEFNNEVFYYFDAKRT
jgi:hypothetical protein